MEKVGKVYNLYLLQYEICLGICAFWKNNVLKKSDTNIGEAGHWLLWDMEINPCQHCGQGKWSRGAKYQGLLGVMPFTWVKSASPNVMFATSNKELW